MTKCWLVDITVQTKSTRIEADIIKGESLLLIARNAMKGVEERLRSFELKMLLSFL